MEYKLKPRISYWKATDPCRKLNILKQRLTEINVVETKNLTDEFITFCIENKERLYLHIVINGMGQTVFEPNIMNVRKMFNQIRKLLQLGFDKNKILVIVKPILPNQNGINALKLLLRLFTEFGLLNLRKVRFQILPYYKDERNQYKVANKNITKRQKLDVIQPFLKHIGPTFYQEYYRLIAAYNAIIHVDDGKEPIIGFRELSAFGLKTVWTDGSKMIEYKNNEPLVNIISEKQPSRCSNRCMLCPFKG